jgi:ribosomal protein L16 Arg81 hydroxylase
MPETALPKSRNLSDDDIVSEQLDPPLSLLARTGIKFQGHHDTHNVFILQLAGSKHWQTFD